MRSKEVIASIAVVGAVATFAVLNMSGPQPGTSFLAENEHNQAFSHFVNKYRKSYATTEEFNYRRDVFMQNYHLIMNHNMMNTEEEGYYMVVNHFADLTQAEFKKMMGYKRRNRTNAIAPSDTLTELVGAIPDSLDWRNENAVTPVKN